MIGNKTDDIITKVSRNSPKNSSGTVTNGTENIVLDRETPKERYISSEKRKKNKKWSRISIIIW